MNLYDLNHPDVQKNISSIIPSDLQSNNSFNPQSSPQFTLQYNTQSNSRYNPQSPLQFTIQSNSQSSPQFTLQYNTQSNPHPDLKDKKKKYYVYLIQSISHPRSTYIGFTVNPKRRIRQHNGLIQGGAKKTRKNRPWKYIGYVSGFPNQRTALQCEWVNNHPKQMGLKFRGGVKGRIRTLYESLLRNKFASTSPPTKSLNLKMKWQRRQYQFPQTLSHCPEVYVSNEKMI